MPWTAASPPDAPTLPASNLGEHRRHQRASADEHPSPRKRVFLLETPQRGQAERATLV